MVEEAQFREVMGHFATGVAVVTARKGDGSAVGLTVSALTSVSLDPTLLLICVHKDAGPHDEIIRRGVFAVNVLSAEQDAMAMHFADEEAEMRFQGMEVESAPQGSPLIPLSLAWLECSISEVLPGGDHSVIVGEVQACGAGPGDPLLFFRGRLKGMGS